MDGTIRLSLLYRYRRIMSVQLTFRSSRQIAWMRPWGPIQVSDDIGRRRDPRLLPDLCDAARSRFTTSFAEREGKPEPQDQAGFRVDERRTCGPHRGAQAGGV